MVVVQKVKTFVMRVVFFATAGYLIGKEIHYCDLNSGKISKLPINSRKYECSIGVTTNQLSLSHVIQTICKKTNWALISPS